MPLSDLVKELMGRIQMPSVTSPTSIYPRPIAPLGVVTPGNVNLYAQPRVKNPDGSTSTVDSWGININGHEYLLPSVTPDGRHLRTEDDVVAEFLRTGRHLGEFESPASSDQYAQRLHNEYVRGVWDKR